MTYCYFHGIVPVCDGRRLQTIRANGSSVWHAVYDSMFLTQSGSDLLGSVRAFAPASMSNLPSNSLINIHGKFMFPVSKDSPEFAIDTLSFDVFVADPSEENYDGFLPSDKVPNVLLLGNVVGAVVQMGDGGKGVDVKVNNFIQNKTVECIYRYVIKIHIISTMY